MRLINRPLALVLAAALMAASIVVMAEVVAFAVHAGPVAVHWPAWYRWAARTHWNELVIRTWSVILIIAGLLVLALELKPGRVSRLPLRSGDQATSTAMTRSGLAGTLRAAALDIDGVRSATVRVRRHRARIAATSAARDRAAADALKEPVAESARRRIEDLQMRHPPRLNVRVFPRSR